MFACCIVTSTFIGCYMITSTILCIVSYHVYWAYLTSLSTQHVIQAPEPSQEAGMYLRVRGINATFSTVFIFYFGIVPRPLTQIRAQLFGFDQALQLKMNGLNLFYGQKHPLLVKCVMQVFSKWK